MSFYKIKGIDYVWDRTSYSGNRNKKRLNIVSSHHFFLNSGRTQGIDDSTYGSVRNRVTGVEILPSHLFIGSFRKITKQKPDKEKFVKYESGLGMVM